MINTVIAILKKQLNELKPSNIIVKNGKVKFEIFTSLFIAIMSFIMISAVIYVLNAFTKSYCVIKINRVLDVLSREYELLNFMAIILFVSTFIYSIVEFEKKIFDSEDNAIFSYLPITSFEIFMSKGIMLYLKEIIIVIPAFLIISLTIFITNGTFTIYKLLFSINLAILLPIIPMCLSTFFCIPVNKIKVALKNHPVQASMIVIILLIVFCFLYTLIFDNIEQIIISGKISSLFSEDIMTTIINITKYSYPTNLFINLVYKKDILFSCLMIVGVVLVVSIASALYINKSLTKSFMQSTRSKKAVFHFIKGFKSNNPYVSMFLREVHTTITSPNYSFICFSNIIVTPIMAFSLSKILIDLISKMIGLVDCSFEISLLVCLLFACSTNSYCSTNISRDGHMALIMKTMPVTNIGILSVKTIYCSTIMILSNIITVIIFRTSNIISPMSALSILVVATFVCTSQILLGTKLDLKHPKFTKDTIEIEEGNDNVATVQVFGFTIIFTMLLLFTFSFFKLVSFKYFNHLISLIIAIFYLLIASLVYFRNINKNFDNLNDNYLEKGGN